MFLKAAIVVIRQSHLVVTLNIVEMYILSKKKSKNAIRSTSLPNN